MGDSLAKTNDTRNIRLEIKASPFLLIIRPKQEFVTSRDKSSPVTLNDSREEKTGLFQLY